MSIKVPYCLRNIEDLTCEDEHQTALIEWSELPETRKKYPALAWLFAVPNGGMRSKATGAKMKQTGVKKGISDLILLYPAFGYHALTIELKYGKNKLSKEQQDFILHHEPLGYRCIVCWNWLDAKRQIINYLSE